MNTDNIYRLLKMTICENTATVKYSDNGRRCDVLGAWGDVPTFEDLRTLRRCAGTISRYWEDRCNGTATHEALKDAAHALDIALDVVKVWGISPAGGFCTIDEDSADTAGALVIVCHDPRGVSRRVDFLSFFGRA